MDDLAHPIEVLSNEQKALLARTINQRVREVSSYDPVTLHEYVMVLVNNKNKTQQEVISGLKPFMNKQTKSFVQWIWSLMEDIYLGREIPDFKNPSKVEKSKKRSSESTDSRSDDKENTKKGDKRDDYDKGDNRSPDRDYDRKRNYDRRDDRRDFDRRDYDRRDYDKRDYDRRDDDRRDYDRRDDDRRDFGPRDYDRRDRRDYDRRDDRRDYGRRDDDRRDYGRRDDDRRDGSRERQPDRKPERNLPEKPQAKPPLRDRRPPDYKKDLYGSERFSYKARRQEPKWEHDLFGKEDEPIERPNKDRDQARRLMEDMGGEKRQRQDYSGTSVRRRTPQLQWSLLQKATAESYQPIERPTEVRRTIVLEPKDPTPAEAVRRVTQQVEEKKPLFDPQDPTPAQAALVLNRAKERKMRSDSESFQAPKQLSLSKPTIAAPKSTPIILEPDLEIVEPSQDELESIQVTIRNSPPPTPRTKSTPTTPQSLPKLRRSFPNYLAKPGQALTSPTSAPGLFISRNNNIVYIPQHNTQGKTT